MQTRFSGQYDDDDLGGVVEGLVLAIVLMNIVIWICILTGGN
jgi:hypothetical protein